jgi:hypothetical protein
LVEPHRALEVNRAGATAGVELAPLAAREAVESGDANEKAVSEATKFGIRVRGVPGAECHGVGRHSAAGVGVSVAGLPIRFAKIPRCLLAIRRSKAFPSAAVLGLSVSQLKATDEVCPLVDFLSFPNVHATDIIKYSMAIAKNPQDLLIFMSMLCMKQIHKEIERSAFGVSCSNR